jgi:TonB family protein
VCDIDALLRCDHTAQDRFRASFVSHLSLPCGEQKGRIPDRKGHMKTVVMCIAISLAMFTTAMAGTPAQLNPERPRRLALYAPPPQYPSEARRKHIQGSGIFMLHVNREGLVTKVDVYRSTGSPILDNSAVSAMKQWRFYPANTPDLVPVPQDFKLH